MTRGGGEVSKYPEYREEIKGKGFEIIIRIQNCTGTSHTALNNRDEVDY